MLDALSIKTKPLLYGGIAGVLLGVPTVIYLSLMSDTAIRQHAAVILAGAGAVYVGFGLAGNCLKTAFAETLVAFLFWAIAIAGVLTFPWLLALGFFAHALWDLAHHLKAINTPLKSWYPPLCAVYDCLVAVFLMVNL